MDERKHELVNQQWNAGDLFFMPKWPTRIYRVHRRKGNIIWYLPSHYGDNPPRGTLRSARYDEEKVSWIKVPPKTLCEIFTI